MTLFLTSSPCWDDVPESCDLPCVFDERNGFVAALRGAVAPGARCAFVASDPSTYDRLEEFADTFTRCFAWHGMPFSHVTLLDNRTADQAERIIRDADVLILAGGHVPTQNAFFQRIRLRELVAGFDGAIMGISAGTMNCAETVYAQPEMPGESIDPDYERFLPGLGLTELNILPHYQRSGTPYSMVGGSTRTSPMRTARAALSSCWWTAATFFPSMVTRRSTARLIASATGA